VNPDRPLDGVRSIKMKLGLLVVASIVVAVVVSQIGDRAGVPGLLTIAVTVTAALGATQWLARGMTSPLREMMAAASAMATGDYSRRVTATSADEVGELARAFNTMATDLATADQQRRQLVATVSHELRTPLAAQQALLENLVDGVVRPDDEVLGTALAQAERLGALVGDLLDLSRVDGGPVPLTLEPLRVREVVDAAVAEVRVSARGLRHEVRVEPADLVVTADAARLAQLLANLLDNAGRHSPVGGMVTVSARPDGADRWWLEVRDEGPGIAAADAERVFTRFGSGSDAAGGTGIGLAIASWVCDLHGGSISVLPADRDHPGARLRAVLPRQPKSPPHPAEEATMPSPSTSPSPSPSPIPPEPPTGPPTGPLGAIKPLPLIESVFGDLWPEAGLAPQPRLLFTAISVGVLAAVVVPFRDVGVGLLAVLLIGGTVVLRSSRFRRRPWTVAGTVVCLGLASLVVLRAAEWLSVLAIVVGILVTTTALSGATGALSVLGGLAGWPLAGLRGLPLLGRTASAASRVNPVWPVVRTVAISLVVLVVFGGLFASADAVFGSWAAALVPDLGWDSIILRFFIGFVVAGSLLAACYLAINPPRVDRIALPAGSPVARAWEWLVPVGLLIVLFVAFVAAQGAALWGGHDYVQRTTGMTYAESVHQGFGQLTVITLLTLGTVALAARKAPRDQSRDRLVLRAVLGGLCVLALVVVASALYRMHVYQQAYGFTVLRVLVDAFELWMGLLLVLVLVSGIRLRALWLPRAAVLSGAIFVLVLGLANPEAWVAQRNIDRYHATGKLDTAYLSSLGPDATPTIVSGLPTELASCLTLAGPPLRPDDLLGWNLGRSRALSLRATTPPSHDPVTCTTWLHTDLP
jgi:signal transduction histidine kinase